MELRLELVDRIRCGRHEPISAFQDPGGDLLIACGTPLGREIATGRVAYAGCAHATRSYRLGIIRPSPGGWERLAELETDLVLPHVQLLPGDEILVASERCRRDSDGRAEANATVFGPDGAARREFVLGDGIAQAQAGSDGRIWVAYSHEGTMGDYGRFGWGRLSADEWVDPVGFDGLVCFDGLDGRKILSYASPVPLLSISDCFALNVWADAAWASYHPEFPVVCIGSVATARGWRTTRRPFDTLAVAGDRVLTCASFDSDPSRFQLGLLGDGEVTEVVSGVMRLPDGGALDNDSWLSARGGRLSAICRGSYYRFDLDALR